jgi:hypothetical protein
MIATLREQPPELTKAGAFQRHIVNLIVRNQQEAAIELLIKAKMSEEEKDEVLSVACNYA